MSEDKVTYQTNESTPTHAPDGIIQEDGSVYHDGESAEVVVATLQAVLGCLAGAAVMMDAAINEGLQEDHLEQAKLQIGGLSAKLKAVIGRIREDMILAV